MNNSEKLQEEEAEAAGPLCEICLEHLSDTLWLDEVAVCHQCRQAMIDSNDRKRAAGEDFIANIIADDPGLEDRMRKK